VRSDQDVAVEGCKISEYKLNLSSRNGGVSKSSNLVIISINTG
jgi:hypothetical protein